MALVPAFGDDLPWSHLRAVVMFRDDQACQIRWSCCTDLATEVDHIWPRAEGGLNVLRNLQAACAPCNKAKGEGVDWSSATREQIGWAVAYRRERLEPQQRELDHLAGVLDVMEDFPHLSYGEVLRREREGVSA